MAGRWAVGVDLGGTKIEVGRVSADGRILEKARRPTHADQGAKAVIEAIVEAVKALGDGDGAPAALGIGVAGQIDDDTGAVIFGPNLDWHDVPLAEDLHQALGLPVYVTNDVRAATFGEWRHGAGRGVDDLLCVFVGTGIGGGVVSGGELLHGCSNTAGEIGHLTVQMGGPRCTCGNEGCLEALAGGWAIARDARDAAVADAEAGATLLRRAGGDLSKLTTKDVAEAAEAGDALSRKLLAAAGEALAAGSVGLVNAFNPCRLVFGGGVALGIPDLVDTVTRAVKTRALGAATRRLEVTTAELGGDAGVVGAAAYALEEVEG